MFFIKFLLIALFILSNALRVLCDPPGSILFYGALILIKLFYSVGGSDLSYSLFKLRTLFKLIGETYECFFDGGGFKLTDYSSPKSKAY